MDKLIGLIILCGLSFYSFSAEVPKCSKKHVKFRKGSMASVDAKSEEYVYSLMPKFWAKDRYVAKELFFEDINGTLSYDKVVVKQNYAGREKKSKEFKLVKYEKVENYFKVQAFDLESFIDMKYLKSGELVFILRSNGVDQCSFKVELDDSAPSY